MPKHTWIPLAHAARLINVPYVTLWRWYVREENRNPRFNRMSYQHSLSVRSDELQRYVWCRKKREASGELTRRQGQAKHALETKQNKDHTRENTTNE